MYSYNKNFKFNLFNFKYHFIQTRNRIKLSSLFNNAFLGEKGHRILDLKSFYTRPFPLVPKCGISMTCSVMIFYIDDFPYLSDTRDFCMTSFTMVTSLKKKARLLPYGIDLAHCPCRLKRCWCNGFHFIFMILHELRRSNN
jgi:hypothetical protein